MGDVPVQPKVTFYTETISTKEKKPIAESELKGSLNGRKISHNSTKEYLMIDGLGENALLNFEIKTLSKKQQEEAVKAGSEFVNEKGQTGIFKSKKWKALTLKTASGEKYTLLVNVKQALNRLNLIGFSDCSGLDIIKSGRLLEVIQNKALQEKVKSISADHYSQMTSMLSDWISSEEISEEDAYAILKGGAEELKKSDGSTFDKNILIRMKENFIFDKKLTDKLKPYFMVDQSKNELIEALRGWISNREILAEEIDELLNAQLVKDCLNTKMSIRSEKHDSNFPIRNLKEMYVFEKTARQLNFNEIDFFKEVDKLCKESKVSYNDMIKNIQDYSKEMNCSAKDALLIKIYVSAYKITPEKALEAIKLGYSGHEVKIFGLGKKGVQAAQVIERAFREFASRKKTAAGVTRFIAAHKRKNEVSREKELFAVDVDNPTGIKYAQSQLNIWHEVSDLTYAKTTDAKTEKLIELNYRINDLLLDQLAKMEKNEEIMQKTTFKVVLDESGNVQASALFKIDEKRERFGKFKKIPLYISYISSAPWNLRISETQDDKRKVRGAATALIESAIYESIKTGTKGAVALEAVPSARSFYESLGFEENSWKPEEAGLISMELSAQGAAKFLASSNAGRAFPNGEISLFPSH